METTTIQGRSIRNVGVLDIRDMAEETLAGIQSIRNVGVLIASPETARLISKLPLRNVGATLEAPSRARLANGQEILGKDAFSPEGEPLDLIANGRVVFMPDIPPEAVEKGLGGLWVNGRAFYPEGLEGAIQPKLRHVNGQARSYLPCDRLVVGDLTLDESCLRSLADGSAVVVLGNLRAPAVLPAELLEARIGKIQVMGRILCREENADAILSRLDTRSGAPKTTVVPAGHVFVEKPVVLDEGVLGSLSGRKLYCSGTVRIDPGVTPEALAEAVDALVCRQLLIAPAGLRKTVAERCDLLQTKAVFYEGELWLVEDASTLVPSRFDYLEGKATLVVRGELTIGEDVAPAILAERLDKVHNFGEIRCTPEQMVAIQARLGLSEGNLKDTTKSGGKKADDNAGGNVGYLKL